MKAVKQSFSRHGSSSAFRRLNLSHGFENVITEMSKSIEWLMLFSVLMPYIISVFFNVLSENI